MFIVTLTPLNFSIPSDDDLLQLTRNNVQSLFNEIWKLPRSTHEDATCADLPNEQKYRLPREKPVSGIYFLLTNFLFLDSAKSAVDSLAEVCAVQGHWYQPEARQEGLGREFGGKFFWDYLNVFANSKHILLISYI